MGTMSYSDPAHVFTFDDRALLHLQMVIGPKLRRNESMFFSWASGPDPRSGRRSIWLATQIPLVFTYDTNDRPQINREWLEALSNSANSVAGLVLVAEPEEQHKTPPAR